MIACRACKSYLTSFRLVHADELKHSGYKKVLDYVSASSRFRNCEKLEKYKEYHGDSWLVTS